jgi:hypothetical protein
MKLKPWVATSLMAALAACGVPAPSPLSPGGEPAKNRYHLLAIEPVPKGPQRGPEGSEPLRVPLPIVGVTASTSAAGSMPGRAIDGDVATAWSDRGPRARAAAITFTFARVHTFSRVRLRTGALPAGITFKVDVSTDGRTWEPASGRLTNPTGGMTDQDVFGTGRYLNVRFFNSKTEPIDRFSVYEFEAYASTAPLPAPPSPTIAPAPAESLGPFAAWYPDWLPLPPRNVFMDGSPDNRQLRFDTALANIGPGHVQVRNRLVNGQKVAVQDILDGEDRIVHSHNASRFVYFAAHGHNHVDDIARYELREGGPEGPVLLTAGKVSFCVEDSFKYRWASTEISRYPDCLPDIMGMTRGYADLYSANLPGQSFNVTGLPAGEYTVVIHSDPLNKFLERTRANNTAWMRLHLDPEAGTFETLGTGTSR